MPRRPEMAGWGFSAFGFAAAGVRCVRGWIPAALRDACRSLGIVPRVSPWAIFLPSLREGDLWRPGLRCVHIMHARLMAARCVHTVNASLGNGPGFHLGVFSFPPCGEPHVAVGFGLIWHTRSVRLCFIASFRRRNGAR
jgi:hypothetical protein